ncbi:fatty acid CoA ligase Acsl3-like isoform X2 [Ornithodoros turicata]
MYGLTVVFRVIATVYDVVTLPIYVFVQWPWDRVRKQKTVWAIRVRKDDASSAIIRTTPDVTSPMFKGIGTMDALFRRTVEKFGNNICLGSREVKDETLEVIQGKTMVKYTLGDYKWKTFREVDVRVEAIGKGIRSLGVEPRSHVVIFAETREEWMMAALACFRNCIVVCTIYATLGDDGIVHGVNETEVHVIITSEELLSRLQHLMTRLPNIKHVVYMRARGKSGHIPRMGDAQVLPFDALLRLDDDKVSTDTVVPEPEDPAIIMYTSGSTGQPKGVIITNSNMMAFMRGVANVLYRFGPEDTFIGFLPLAHVMEIAAESVFMALGVRIGYSSPFTLTDKGTALKPGIRGDATVLTPTVMIAVPLLLNRIQKAIEENIASKGCLSRALFRFAVDYKAFWRAYGFTTPFLNTVVFRKTKQVLGGRLKLIICGSAPLSRKTHRLLSTCMDCPVAIGYGLTETTAGATLQDVDDNECPVAGPPLTGTYIKLEDWQEGGYSTRDVPNPRGEVVVGGPTVTAGYYKRPELTAQYYEEKDGIRWFHTGDIGELLPNGNVKIIDRRKDLVKLQYGEYVSLGKVESVLITNALVDNVCVCGNSLSTYTVALVMPNEAALREFARSLNIGEKASMEVICEDPNVISAVTLTLIGHCQRGGLMKFEIPQKYKLCKEVWSPNNELVTAALKIRRLQLYKFYDKDIKALYSEG